MARLNFKDIEREIKKLKNLKIVFLEPARLHPHSDNLTIADVAMILEAKYGLCKKFIKYKRKELIDKILAYVLENGNSKYLMRMESWLKDEWRDYIVNELHGIKTKASKERGDESFINTSAYYKSMLVKIVL